MIIIIATYIFTVRYTSKSYIFNLFSVFNTVNLFRTKGKTLQRFKISLKGHGIEANFLGFLQKLVPHSSLTLPFEPFRFHLRIRGDIYIRKTTPRYHRYGESPTPRTTDTRSRWFITDRLESKLISSYFSYSKANFISCCLKAFPGGRFSKTCCNPNPVFRFQ